MFERFTDAARRVVVGAQGEAAALDHHYIGTEHLLLGMTREDAGAGFRLLQLFDLPGVWVRQRVEEIVGRGTGDRSPSGHIPFTPRAKKVLEQSLREAIRLGDRFIGSEHLLLGLLREGGGVAAQVLAERGVTLDAVAARLGDVEREPAPEPEAGDPPRTFGEGDDGEGMIHVPAEDFARLVGEAARLRDLLRHHGLDPDEQPPGIGDEGDTPVA